MSTINKLNYKVTTTLSTTYLLLKTQTYLSRRKIKNYISIFTRGINQNTFKFILGPPIYVSYRLTHLYDILDFVLKLQSFLAINESYLVLIKVRYQGDTYKMAGKSFGLKYNDSTDLENVYHVVLDSLQKLFEVYGHAEDDIEYIQLIFRKIDKKFLSDILFDKTHVNKKSLPLLNKIIKLFPVTNNEDILGNRITDIISLENKISEVNINLNGLDISFMDNIRKQNEILKAKNVPEVEFSNDYAFYLRDGTAKPNILAVATTGDVSVKQAFTLEGVSLGTVQDKVVSKDGENILLRKVSNKTVTIKNNNIIHSENIIMLDPIKRSDVIKQRLVENPNIGVIDMETFTDTRVDYAKAYAVGLYCAILSKPITFYINRNLESDILVLKLIDEMFNYKYKGILWYCHRFGHFDALFILKVITNYNISDKGKLNPYILDPIFRDSDLLKLKIGKRVMKSSTIAGTSNKLKEFKIVYITLLDSYAILPNDLHTLGKEFNVEVLKGIFPYRFVNEKNIFYRGCTPDISWYDKTSQEEYKKIYSDSWFIERETIKYLETDLITLYPVITEANNKLNLYFGVDITKCLTISRMAYVLNY